MKNKTNPAAHPPNFIGNSNNVESQTPRKSSLFKVLFYQYQFRQKQLQKKNDCGDIFS
jgi:hypothetical protein